MAQLIWKHVQTIPDLSLPPDHGKKIDWTMVVLLGLLAEPGEDQQQMQSKPSLMQCELKNIIAQVECCLLICSGDSKGFGHGDLRMVFRSDVAKSVASKLSGPSGWANLFLELLDIVTVRFPKSFASGALVSVIQREQIPQLENAHMEGWWIIQCLRALPMLKRGCPMLPCLPAANECRSLAQHCTVPAKSANLSQCTHPSTCSKLQQSHGLLCL